MKLSEGKVAAGRSYRTPIARLGITPILRRSTERDERHEFGLVARASRSHAHENRLAILAARRGTTLSRRGIDYRGIDTSGIPPPAGTRPSPSPTRPSPSLRLARRHAFPSLARLSFAALIILRAASRPASHPPRPAPRAPARRSNLIARGVSAGADLSGAGKTRKVEEPPVYYPNAPGSLKSGFVPT